MEPDSFRAQHLMRLALFHARRRKNQQRKKLRYFRVVHTNNVGLADPTLLRRRSDSVLAHSAYGAPSANAASHFYKDNRRITWLSFLGEMPTKVMGLKTTSFLSHGTIRTTKGNELDMRKSFAFLIVAIATAALFVSCWSAKMATPISSSPSATTAHGSSTTIKKTSLRSNRTSTFVPSEASPSASASPAKKSAKERAADEAPMPPEDIPPTPRPH